jgi:16S rRNA (adenine1518-N6/adenine1519-N6)-dimethyltransferase
MNNIDAKQSLGQNWLVNEGVADRIVAAAHPERGDIILEVGPGKGVLTGRLVRHVGELIAIEKDERLIGPLREQFANTPNVSVHEGDILELDPQALNLMPYRYKVVANLPYYITARFLRLMLSSWPPPKRAVLMVQREVAQRLQATAGDMNMLALATQAYARIEKIMDVSRGSFRPEPNVDSAVMAFEPKVLEREERESIERILSFAKPAFEQRRKQVGNTLPATTFEACSVPQTARPQELDWSQWECLASPRGE